SIHVRFQVHGCDRAVARDSAVSDPFVGGQRWLGRSSKQAAARLAQLLEAVFSASNRSPAVDLGATSLNFNSGQYKTNLNSRSQSMKMSLGNRRHHGFDMPSF
ncbi:hypothetical protein, partial [Ralstonia pseudosolanacearum]|uniref:hypothetical protein n=1 Tax=Ralstonia pseudosolanacearum TaxID=1310165 RepID=UPI003CF11C92